MSPDSANAEGTTPLILAAGKGHNVSVAAAAAAAAAADDDDDDDDDGMGLVGLLFGRLGP
jgi:hypothetical protein